MFKAGFLPVLWLCIFRNQSNASYTWMEVYKWTLRVSSFTLHDGILKLARSPSCICHKCCLLRAELHPVHADGGVRVDDAREKQSKLPLTRADTDAMMELRHQSHVPEGMLRGVSCRCCCAFSCSRLRSSSRR